MNRKYIAIQTIKNNRGILTAEFIFSMVLASIMIIILLATTATLSVIEISQYIAFSVARSYSVASLNESVQDTNAHAKFTELVSNKVLAPLFNPDSGLFTLSNLDLKNGGGDSNVGNNIFSDYYTSDPEKLPFTGVRLTLTATLLKRKFPLLGSTTNGSQDNLSTYITAFLFNEPNTENCRGQMNSIYLKWQTFGYDNYFLSQESGLFSNRLSPMVEDNGC